MNILPFDHCRAVLEAGVGQQFRGHLLQLTKVGIHVGDQLAILARVGLLFELIKFERQPRDRCAQFVRHRIGQLALIGDQALDARRHQIEVLGQIADVRAPRQLDAHRQIVVAETLGRQPQLFQIAPVRAHPEKQDDADQHCEHHVRRGDVERHQARLRRQLDAEQLRATIDVADELRVIVADHQQVPRELGIFLRCQGQLIGLDQTQRQTVVRTQ